MWQTSSGAAEAVKQAYFLNYNPKYTKYKYDFTSNYSISISVNIPQIYLAKKSDEFENSEFAENYFVNLKLVFKRILQ